MHIIPSHVIGPYPGLAIISSSKAFGDNDCNNNFSTFFAEQFISLMLCALTCGAIFLVWATLILLWNIAKTIWSCGAEAVSILPGREDISNRYKHTRSSCYAFFFKPKDNEHERLIGTQTVNTGPAEPAAAATATTTV